MCRRVLRATSYRFGRAHLSLPSLLALSLVMIISVALLRSGLDKPAPLPSGWDPVSLLGYCLSKAQHHPPLRLTPGDHQCAASHQPPLPTPAQQSDGPEFQILGLCVWLCGCLRVLRLNASLRGSPLKETGLRAVERMDCVTAPGQIMSRGPLVTPSIPVFLASTCPNQCSRYRFFAPMPISGWRPAESRSELPPLPPLSALLLWFPPAGLHMAWLGLARHTHHPPHPHLGQCNVQAGWVGLGKYIHQRHHST